jgi:hypothetical protein
MVNIFKHSFFSGTTGSSLQVSEEPGVLGAVVVGFSGAAVVSLYNSATGTTTDPVCVIRKNSAGTERYDIGSTFSKGLFVKLEEAGSITDVTVLWV